MKLKTFKTFKTLVFIFTVFFSTVSFADSVYFHLPVTEHWPGVSYETENNYGIGWQRDAEVIGNWSPMAGVYNNSQDNAAFYAGLYKEFPINDYMRYGYGGMLVTGYSYGPVIPVPVGYVEIGPVRILAIPGAFNVTLTVLTF